MFLQLDQRNDVNIVFVSGLFAGAEIWSSAIRYLNGYNLYVMNMPLCKIDNKIAGLKDKINDFISGLDRVVLVGNSLGGYLALALAAENIHNNICGVIFSGAAGLDSRELSIDARAPKDEAFLDKLISLTFYNAETVSDDIKCKTAEVFSERRTQLNILKLSRESKSLNALPLIERLNMPAVAVWGKYDQVSPGKGWKSPCLNNGVSFHSFEYSGHSPMIEEPIFFSNVIKDVIEIV